MKLRAKVLLNIFLAVAMLLQSLPVGRDKLEGGSGRVPRTRLLKWYAEANRDYFDDRLPHDTEIVWDDLRYKSSMGDTVCNEQGCRIRIDVYTNVAPATAQETEYHEMCHVATRGEVLDHGPEFKNCMTTLFKKGALDGLI